MTMPYALLMQLNAVGAFQIDADGLAGMLDLDLQPNQSVAQLAALAGFEFSANMNMLVNSTGKVKPIELPRRFNTLDAFDATPAQQAAPNVREAANADAAISVATLRVSFINCTPP